MRIAITLAVMATLLGPSLPAEARSRAAQCRKACKPAISECVALTGQPKRTCRKSLISLCKQVGVEACSSGATTTTTVPSSDGTTTTTTLPRPAGFLGFGLEELAIDDSSDPGTYEFLAYFNPDDRFVPLQLDASMFSIQDDGGARYDAVPVDAPDFCGPAVTIQPDQEVTCWVRFVVPLSVGVIPRESLHSIARVHFDGGGWSRKSSFRIYADGSGYGLGG